VCSDYFFKTERDIDKLVPETAMNRLAEQIIFIVSEEYWWQKVI
jgi:hypothetical protein